MTLEGEAALSPAATTTDEAPPDADGGAGTTATGHEGVVERAARTERSAGAHFPCLDAYRGIAMTMILVTHAGFSTGFYTADNAWSRTLGPYLVRLDLAVPMFFVLSAFLLYRPFALATIDGRPTGRVTTFWRRRALRILPAYWFALLGLGLIVGLPVASAKGWIGNALLLPAFGVPVQACDASGACHTGYAISQAWTIGIEISFYLALPLFAALVHRVGRDRTFRSRVVVMLVSAGLVYAVGTAFRVYIVVVRPSWAEQSLLWLPMFLDVFGIGLALAALSAAVSRGMVLPHPLAWLSEHPWVSWALALGIWLIVTRLSPPDRPFGFESADGTTDYLPRQFIYGVSAALWLLPGMLGDQRRTRLRAVLASRFPVYLGAISLSFYLWHLGVMDEVKSWTVPGWDALVQQAAHPRPGSLDGLVTFTGSMGTVVVLTWCLTFVVASVCYVAIERPFLRLKRVPLRDLVHRAVHRRLPSAPT
jgi:peptidoglycan/LPS O-acetylase OafA/YrhL